MAYTERQLELIRARVKEYYDLHHYGPRKMSWEGFCDDILDNGQEPVRSEPLRQWVTGFVAKDRTQSLHPTAEEWDSVVSFLMHPDIDMLLPEELKDPEIPHRFLRSFLEYLRIDPNSPLRPPPRTLSSGVYEAWHQVEDPDQIEEKWIKTNLSLELDHNSRNVRATEMWEIHFRGGDQTGVLSGSRPSEGWGIVTPEGSLFMVMKTKPYVRNYYYLPVLSNPLNLVLLRHQPSHYGGDTPHSFKELDIHIKSRTLLLSFKKVANSNPDKGG